MNATTATAGRAAAPAGNGGETAPPALRRQKMQAIVQDTHSAADVWRAGQIALPEIAGHEVLVKVHAAGLDRGTWRLMAGELTPVIDKTYPAAPSAWRHALPRSGIRPGKLVITVTGAG
jgi:hypothetical protein